ncbi:unnamed protein product [Adineta ricciae]|uniref:Uncharacterized protein n=1 Tax=Adineta ricciae TaxID=249248 RepID=A0A813S593_ADIRI|nr:unnamed protein product [Adineta ricciae]
MTAVHYIDDYTFHIPDIGLPPNLNFNQFAPHHSNSNNDPSFYPQQRIAYTYSQQESEPESIRPLVIRRHEPGSTDPPVAKEPIPVIFLTPMLQPPLPPILPEHIQPTTIQSNPSQSTPESIPIQPTSIQQPAWKSIGKQQQIKSVLVDPNDRPIRPMKDTSVYNNPPSSFKPLPSVKRVHSASSRQTGPFHLPPKPARASSFNKTDQTQSTFKTAPSPSHDLPSRLQSAIQPPRSPPQKQPSRLESRSKPPSRLQSASKLVAASPTLRRPDLHPSSPSRNSMRNVSARRPIRTDIKTIFDNELPQHEDGRRPMLMHELDTNSYGYSETHIRSAPKRIHVYEDERMITTYGMPNRRVVGSQPIIYRTPT